MKKYTTVFIAIFGALLVSCSSDNGEVETKTFTTQLSKTSINFGNVEVAEERKETFLVTNTGTQAITISNITAPTGFSVSPTSGTINSGDFINFTVTFIPNAIDIFNGNIVITSNSTSTANTISVSGTGSTITTGVKTYENTIASIMNKSCSTTGCHSGQNPAGSVSLTNFDEVKNGFIVDDSWGEITSGRMPKAGVSPLTQDDKDNLETWINAGYPSGELKITSYVTDVAPLINQSCATTNCHGGAQSPTLSNYSQVKTAFEATGNLSSIGRIESGNMPKNSANLAQSNIDLLKTWINTGFIEQ
ncbi:choice-of-anchor D domain-containing protein [Flavicella marina]|uniref:choice-of-anchor D domain-containing protein n=1 Tax=Flavicella marina TaxID=1475951 RepID=UPI0012653EB9|nr:choice-of-anchor D domain-containing protein [Flavicella marina]